MVQKHFAIYRFHEKFFIHLSYFVYIFPGYGGGHRGGHNYGGNRGGGRYDQDRRGDHPGSHANFGRRDRRDSDRRQHNSEEFKEPSAGKTPFYRYFPHFLPQIYRILPQTTLSLFATFIYTKEADILTICENFREIEFHFELDRDQFHENSLEIFNFV